MAYLLIKSLHVCAIIFWVAGLLLQALLLPMTRSLPQAHLRTLRRWDRLVSTPFMLIAWMSGLFLAEQGGWFGSRWLLLKLAVVVALAALHGVLAGRLRRSLTSQSPDASALSIALPSLIVMTAGIVLLVITKPF